MYLDRERVVRLRIKRTKENPQGEPIDLGSKTTSIEPAYLPEESPSDSGIVIKSPEDPENFRTVNDYIDALKQLKVEHDFLTEHTAFCPQLVKLIHSVYSEKGGLKELHLQRVYPLENFLTFIKAQGLLTLLSVYKEMYNYLRYVHSQGKVDRDFKIDNFGLDYDHPSSTRSEETPLKRYDVSLNQDNTEAPSDTVVGTLMNMPFYVFYKDATPENFVKSDIFAFALTLYDLITCLARKALSGNPNQLPIYHWAHYHQLPSNHAVRFQVEDLLFITNNNEEEAANLTCLLNGVLEKALSVDENEAYGDVGSLYRDFLQCFESYLTDEQLRKLMS